MKVGKFVKGDCAFFFLLGSLGIAEWSLARMNIKKLSLSLRNIHQGYSGVVQQVERLEREADNVFEKFEAANQAQMSLAVEDIPNIGNEAKQAYELADTVAKGILRIVDRLGQMQSKAAAMASHSKGGAELSLSIKNRSHLVADETAQLTSQLASNATIISGLKEMLAADTDEVTKILKLIGKERIEEWLNELPS